MIEETLTRSDRRPSTRRGVSAGQFAHAECTTLHTRARPLAETPAGLLVGVVLFNWFSRTAGDADPADLFVEKVTVRPSLRPVDTFVVVGWLLILLKCVLASVAIHVWDMPVHDFYVWGPSCIFGAVCTYLYLRRDE